jgi:hypothetical protein
LRACRYKTAPGRSNWPNRDQLGERGFELLRQKQSTLLGDGPTLYVLARNDAINRHDKIGLCCCGPEVSKQVTEHS